MNPNPIFRDVLLSVAMIAFSLSSPSLTAQEKPIGLFPVGIPLSSISQNEAQDRLRKLDEYIESARQQWNVPGLSIAIVHQGQLLHCKGYGVKKAGSQDLVDSDTLFAIASNTKAFTAAALAILVDEKKLKWDDRVQTHLPAFQLYDEYVSHEMRIVDLLCHRSGLGTFSGDLLWYGTPYTPSEILAKCRHLKPAGPFRSQFGYSNVMFLAAGLVVEKVSGQSCESFIRDRILRPIGMTRSITSVRDLISKGNYATPHKTLSDSSEPIAWVNWDAMMAAGGIISSAKEMSQWMQLQLNKGTLGDSKIFSEAASNEMWQSHTSLKISPEASKRYPWTHFRSYGLGWALSDYAGKKLVAHGGGYDGMYSHQILIPEEKFGVIVLTNSMTSIPDSIAYRAVDMALGLPDRDWSSENLEKFKTSRVDFRKRVDEAILARAEGTKPSHPMQSYTGSFECPLMGAATVSLEKDQLVFQIQSNPELIADLKHLHYDTFVLHWRQKFAWFDEGTILFVANARGDFESLKLDVPNEDLWFHELDFHKRK